MPALPSRVSCRSILWNPLLDHILDWISFINFRHTPFFPCFKYLIKILSFTCILSISQLQTQWLMASRIRSRIEYLIPTYNIFYVSFTLKFDRNLTLLVGSCYRIYWQHSVRAYFLDHNMEKVTHLIDGLAIYNAFFRYYENDWFGIIRKVTTAILQFHSLPQAYALCLIFLRW